jgi:DNA end-binding protein Ku
MAASSTRVLWKGAISLGLVHIPVRLHSAVEEGRKMRLIDQASMSPVGHKNVSKATGELVAQADIVKGLEVDGGRYVLLTPQEIREALPKSTQTIELEAFVQQDHVPLVFFSKPYYVAPAARGAKPFALLRDVLRRTGRVGLGKVVIATKQHLAVVAPYGDGLVLELLRWHEEIRSMDGLQLPGSATSVGITERELKMGESLVMDLSDDWHPERYKDEFRLKVEALSEHKNKAGQAKELADLLASEISPAATGVDDLAELLRRSLRGATAAPPSRPAGNRRSAANDEQPQRAVAASRTGAKARTSAKPTGRKKGAADKRADDPGTRQ